MIKSLLKRSTTNPVTDLENKLAGLVARRDALDAKLQEAAGALTRATDDRRQSLMDADLDDEQASSRRDVLIRACADRHDSIRDALRELGKHIAEVEAGLIEARDTADRSQAASEMRTLAEAPVSAIKDLRKATKDLLATGTPLAQRVNAAPDLMPRCQLLLDDVAAALETLVQDGRNAAIQIESGHRAVTREPVPQPDAPMHIETPAEILNPKKGLPPSFRETVGRPRTYIGSIAR